MEQQQSRNNYIDVVRGICVICVVWGHTVFWSGQFYVPVWMQSMGLVFEIPALFFLSGMTYAVVKREYIISAIFRLITIYVLLTIILDAITMQFTFPNLFRVLFLQMPVYAKYPVVGGSYWFVPLYIAVLIMTTMWVKYIPKFLWAIVAGMYLFYFVFFFLDFPVIKVGMLGTTVNFFLFYGMAYLLGYLFQDQFALTRHQRKFAIALFVVGVLGFTLSSLTVGEVIDNFQKYKFPVTFPYLSSALVSMAGIAFFYKNDVTNKYLTHLGQNAIYYYAAQGVSSSVVYRLLRPTQEWAWPPRLALLFVVNMILAVLIAELLRILYKKIGDFISARLLAPKDEARS